MTREDPHELADALEHQVDELERESQAIRGQVEETREDWKRKRADENVPGAVPPGESNEPAESEEPPEAAAKG